MTDATAEERWQILQRIGAYAAGELSGEETLKAGRLVLKNAGVRRLADSYARMLTLLRTIGEKSPEVPKAVIDRAVRQAVDQARACQGHQEKGETRCSKGRPKK